MLSPRDIYPPEWFTECGPPPEQRQRQKAPVKRTAKTRNYERQQLTSGCVLLVMKKPNHPKGKPMTEAKQNGLLVSQKVPRCLRTAEMNSCIQE